MLAQEAFYWETIRMAFEVCFENKAWNGLALQISDNHGSSISLFHQYETVL